MLAATKSLIALFCASACVFVTGVLTTGVLAAGVFVTGVLTTG